MSRTPTDWTIWLPKAFFLDWSDRTKWYHNLSDPTIWLPLGIFPQEIREGIVNNYYIRISKTQGDIIGVGVSGNTNTIGKNIISGSINDSKSQSFKTEDKYAKALEDFSDTINKQFKDYHLPEEQVKSINNSLDELKIKILI